MRSATLFARLVLTLTGAVVVIAACSKPEPVLAGTTKDSGAGDDDDDDDDDTPPPTAKKDAAVDARVFTFDSGSEGGGPTGALPFGSSCQTAPQCADGLCVDFDGDKLCTKACNGDSDCPNDDCDDSICNLD